MSLRHVAGYIHAGIYAIPMLFLFSWPIVCMIGISHLLIDTRVPIDWLIKIMKKTDIPVVRLGNDQVLHIVVIVLATFLQVSGVK